MRQIDQFTVEQERGKDSAVTVFSDILRAWPEDKKILEFETDQSLASNSDRAWEVKDAIKKYASPLGYRLLEEHKNIMQFVYDPRAHSGVTTYQIQEQIKSDDRFQALVNECKERRNKINGQFRPAISQLKNLITQLEKANQSEVDALSQKLISLQQELLAEHSPLPEEISDFDRKRLEEPNYPLVKMGTDNYYGKKDWDTIPDSLDWILDLL